MLTWAKHFGFWHVCLSLSGIACLEQESWVTDKNDYNVTYLIKKKVCFIYLLERLRERERDTLIPWFTLTLSQMPATPGAQPDGAWKLRTRSRFPPMGVRDSPVCAVIYCLLGYELTGSWNGQWSQDPNSGSVMSWAWDSNTLLTSLPHPQHSCVVFSELQQVFFQYCFFYNWLVSDSQYFIASQLRNHPQNIILLNSLETQSVVSTTYMEELRCWDIEWVDQE